MDHGYRDACLSAMDITRYVRRDRLSGELSGQPDVELDAVPALSPETLPQAVDPDIAEAEIAPVQTPVADNWQQLASEVASCTACELHTSRSRTVFGVGNQAADLLVIGEAPGAEEDKQGEPFVGAAGQLLTAMLQAIGMQREQVYIANVVKCRPPGNRNPGKAEAGACRHFLDRQIEMVQPRVILSVGAVSAHNLLLNDESVGRLRQRPHRYGKHNIPLLVTYHPAYLLRSPAEKAKVWLDLQKLVHMLK